MTLDNYAMIYETYAECKTVTVRVRFPPNVLCKTTYSTLLVMKLK